MTERVPPSFVLDERRLATVVRDSNDAVFVLDLEGTILAWNRGAERAYGYTDQEALGMNIRTITDGPSHEPMTCIHESIAAGEGVASIEVRRKAKDGRVVHVWLTATLLSDKQGNPAGIAATERDLTERRAEQERRRLDEKIRHTQKLESLGVLAGGIAHDFNNLLMGVLGNVEIALMEVAPESTIRPRLEGIKTTAVRLSELTRQMLAYSGRGVFLVGDVNLSKLVEEMGRLLEVSIPKNVVLKYELVEQLPAIRADASQIRQVVMNLITNGVEATGEKSGVVSISTGVVEADPKYLESTHSPDVLAPGCYVFVEMSDTGCGMDAETRRKMFDPFFSTKPTGQGLGLAAVLGIVRGHKGVLRVYSEPGRGTSIKVLFPRSEETERETQVERGEKRSTAAAAWGSGTILVVDDDETVRAMARIYLEKMGFAVVTAADGVEALRLMQESDTEVDAIVLDLTMPHMDGIEAFKELRRMGVTVPVILSSGYNQQDATQHLAGRGLAGFLQKPYDFASLEKALKDVLP